MTEKIEEEETKERLCWYLIKSSRFNRFAFLKSDIDATNNIAEFKEVDKGITGKEFYEVLFNMNIIIDKNLDIFMNEYRYIKLKRMYLRSRKNFNFDEILKFKTSYRIIISPQTVQQIRRSNLRENESLY
jgi:hypothetical protein